MRAQRHNSDSSDNVELNTFLVLIGICLIFIAGFRQIGFDQDSLQYLSGYNDFASFVDANFLEREPSYWLITWFTKAVFSDSVRPLLLIYATLGVSINVWAIKTTSRYPIIAIYCYILLFFPIHEMTQIRVGVACAIFLSSTSDLTDRKFNSFLLKAAFATFFHYSAVVVILVYLIKPKNINIKFYALLPLSGLGLGYFNNVLFIILNNIAEMLPGFIGNKIQMYITLLSMNIGDQINLFNIYYTCLLIVFYYSIFNISKFKSNHDVLIIKILGWVLFIYYSMSFLPVVAVRVSELFSVVIIFLLPALVGIFKSNTFATVVILLFPLSMFINNIFVHRLFNF